MHIWGEREKERARKRPENRREKDRDRETAQPSGYLKTLGYGNAKGIGIG